MTPPILYEMLRSLDEFLSANVWLMESDPDEFYNRAERFIAFVVSRAFREGARRVLEQLRTPSTN